MATAAAHHTARAQADGSADEAARTAAYEGVFDAAVAAEQSIANQAMNASVFFRWARKPGEPVKKTTGDQSLNLHEIIAEKKKRAGSEEDGKPGADSPEEKNDIFIVANPAYENQRLQADEAMKEMNEERKRAVLHDPYLLVTYQLAVGMMK